MLLLLWILFPRTRIVRSSLFRHCDQISELCAKMYCLVCVEGYRYQVTRIHQVQRTRFNVFHRQRVHVMDQDPVMNIVSFNAQVASVIAEDDDVADALPLFRAVKHLVETSVVTKCLFTNFARQAKVFVSFFKCREGYQFVIGSNNLPHYRPDTHEMPPWPVRTFLHFAFEIRSLLSSHGEARFHT